VLRDSADGGATLTVKGILFDKDGTLLDFHRTWMPAYRAAAAMVCREAGREGLEARLLQIGGYDRERDRCDPASVLACGTTAELARVWAREAGIADADALGERLERVFEREAAAHPVPVADLGVLFERLRGRGLTLGVATMDSASLAHAVLRKLGVDAHVDFVCGYDSGYGEKPAAGMAQAFLAHCGLAAAEIAVVGDTPHDLRMGRAAGAGLVVAVLSGASERETLAPLCDRVIGSVAEIETLLG